MRTLTIAVRSDANGLDARAGLNEIIGLNDSAEPIAVGEQVYVRDYVLPRLSAQEIGETTREWFGNFPTTRFPTAGDVTLQEAVQVATDLIKSAAKMTIAIPASSGIGGPIDVRLLGNAARPVRLQ